MAISEHKEDYETTAPNDDSNIGSGFLRFLIFGAVFAAGVLTGGFGLAAAVGIGAYATLTGVGLGVVGGLVASLFDKIVDLFSPSNKVKPEAQGNTSDLTSQLSPPNMDLNEFNKVLGEVVAKPGTKLRTPLNTKSLRKQHQKPGIRMSGSGAGAGSGGFTQAEVNWDECLRKFDQNTTMFNKELPPQRKLEKFTLLFSAEIQSSGLTTKQFYDELLSYAQKQPQLSLQDIKLVTIAAADYDSETDGPRLTSQTEALALAAKTLAETTPSDSEPDSPRSSASSVASSYHNALSGLGSRGSSQPRGRSQSAPAALPVV